MFIYTVREKIYIFSHQPCSSLYFNCVFKDKLVCLLNLYTYVKVVILIIKIKIPWAMNN